QYSDQIFGIYRLRQTARRAHASRFREIERLVFAEGEDYRDLIQLRLVLDVTADFISVLSGHYHIEHNQMRRKFMNFLNSEVAAADAKHFIALIVQQLLHLFLSGYAVFCNQNSARHKKSSSCSLPFDCRSLF